MATLPLVPDARISQLRLEVDPTALAGRRTTLVLVFLHLGL